MAFAVAGAQPKPTGECRTNDDCLCGYCESSSGGCKSPAPCPVQVASGFKLKTAKIDLANVSYVDQSGATATSAAMDCSMDSDCGSGYCDAGTCRLPGPKRPIPGGIKGESDAVSQDSLPGPVPKPQRPLPPVANAADKPAPSPGIPVPRRPIPPIAANPIPMPGVPQPQKPCPNTPDNCPSIQLKPARLIIAGVSALSAESCRVDTDCDSSICWKGQCLPWIQPWYN